MSELLTTVSAIPGVKDLWTLLAFLNDAKAVERRLGEVTAQETRLNARIAEVGKAGEVESLWAKARAERQEASELKELARADATALKSAALEERDAAVAEAAKTRQGIVAERAALAAAVGAAARVAQERESQVRAREVAVEQTAARSAQEFQAAQAIKAEFETRLERLKAATVAAGG